MYTSLVNILRKYDEQDGLYAAQPFRPLEWVKKNEELKPEILKSAQPVIRASAIYETLQALLEVKRPDSEAGWQAFASSRNIAWKRCV